MTRGGLNTRLLQVTSAQVLNMVRGLAAAEHALNAQVAALIKTAGHFSGALEAAVSQLSRGTGLGRGAASPAAAGTARSLGLLRGTIDATVLFLVATSARFRSLGAVDGQAAANVAQHQRPVMAPAVSAQLAAMTQTSVRSHLLLLGAVSAQVLGVARGISHAAAAFSGAAQTTIRAVGRALSAVSAEATALVAPGLHSIVTHVSAAQAVFLRASHILVRGVASPETVSSVRSGRTVPAAVAALSASAAGIRRAVLSCDRGRFVAGAIRRAG